MYICFAGYNAGDLFPEKLFNSVVMEIEKSLYDDQKLLKELQPFEEQRWNIS